jgi:ATP/maltotriose-dependent transcriptional regulator MalT
MAWLAGGRQVRRRVLSKPEPQVSYLRELRPETTASQLQRAAVRHVPVRRHGPVWEVVSWLRTGSGLSNNQIGQRLFLSPRTAGGHLHRIFPKLGITSQAALYAALTSLPQRKNANVAAAAAAPVVTRD